MEKNNIKKIRGRPLVIKESVIQKLELAFSLDCSDEEACSFANISESTLYNYQKDNSDFLERKHRLKQRPVLKARQTIVKGLDEPEHAKWYLERKLKKEFASRPETENDNRTLVILINDNKASRIANREILESGEEQVH